jgi:hypothetical protein
MKPNVIDLKRNDGPSADEFLTIYRIIVVPGN